eukprot:153205_1
MSTKFNIMLIIAAITITVLSDNTVEETNKLKSEDTEIPINSKQKIEDCEIYTTLQQLRDKFGSNQYSLIQGLNARESRRLYHKLLPKCIINSPRYESLSICEKAHKAYSARQADKKYTRERSNLLVSLSAKLLDLWRHKRFDGATDTYLWNKKAKKLNVKECVIDIYEKNKKEVIWNNNKCSNVCVAMLKSSTKTNKQVDELFASKNNDQKDAKNKHNEL